MKKLAYILGIMFLAMALMSLFCGKIMAESDIFVMDIKEMGKGAKGYAPREIIVKFKPGVKEDVINEINRGHGNAVLHSSLFAGFKRMRIPNSKTVEEMIAIYSKNPNVEYAEPNFLAEALMIPNDPYYSLQWHMDNPFYGGINMECCWDMETGDPGVIVAVIDTGVAYENYGRSYVQAPDLAETSFVQGYDFVNNDNHPNDDNHHGTHVAGTIAQSTNNNVGVAGVAHNCSIMPVKVLDRNGSGTHTDIADGIYYAADNGANVINLSLGGIYPSSTLENALSYAYNAGVTIVCSAGNSYEEGNPPCYPAAYDAYCIAVGATRWDETRAYYSNTGSYIDLTAPGGDLNVDQNGDGYGDGILQQTFSLRNPRYLGYYFFQGTSMAAPHVSGVAALLIANGVSATPNSVRNVLELTAEDKGTVGWDEEYGFGIVDACAALQWTSGPIDNPPTVIITLPLDEATVSGIITIEANAFDDLGVIQVDFYYDDTFIGTDATAPYSIEWDSSITGNDGAYTLTATAIDNALQEASDSISVTVDNINDPPVADAGPDQSASVGGPVNFDGSNSSDPDGNIVSYLWDFGDETTETTATATHSYLNPGTYTVTLTVTDNGGLTGEDTTIVTVSEESPEVELFYDSFEIGEWNGLWSDDYQNDWFRSTQRATDGSYSAEVDGRASDAQLISIPIDLQGKASVKISFSWYIEQSLDSGEYVTFDVSTNGGVSWIEKARLKGNVDTEDQWHDVSIELTAITSLKLRFRGKMSSSNEDANLDNVKVIGYQ